MDARVNDFLNEINEIAPLNESKEESVWEKCYDEESGYYYYWNTKTNEVTWDMPSEYRAMSKVKTKKCNNLYIPPRTAPLFPSANSLLPPVSDAIKIYKIGECSESIAGTSSKVSRTVKRDVSSPNEEKKVSSKPFRRRSDSDDEKIVLISSYGGDSESDNEQPPKENKLVNGSSKSKSNTNSDEEDDVDILTKIQKKAKELKKLGGELPTEVKQIVEEPPPSKQSENRGISGFSLVAGYSDSEEEAEVDSPKNFLSQENKVAHSTLFPVTKPIDVKDFEESSKRQTDGDEGFDPKAFQRKRRIGVALVNTGKKLKVDEDSERKGLGFSTDSNSNDTSSPCGSTYPGFKNGGVMFVKADVLNPPAIDTVVEQPEKISTDIEDTYTTLKEKLGFLSEGREQVSPVQVMLIQIETLYSALKAGDLKQSYLKKWLEETCSDLIKLEKETTPEGWLLQWDRLHKRYYYQNVATGESQWEYPQADVTVCDEAMDICTTPPPSDAEPTIHMSPPLPPAIRSPSPPPPPTISDCKSGKKKKCDIPLPPEPKEATSAGNAAAEKFDNNGEPLPPGVDPVDVATKSKETVKENDLNDVLNSFYSDIAAIETSNSPPLQHFGEEAKGESSQENVPELAKKKKKTKVKLAQGIAMKKKGVSKLVEKWKNVQLSYND